MGLLKLFLFLVSFLLLNFHSHLLWFLDPNEVFCSRFFIICKFIRLVDYDNSVFVNDLVII